MKKKLCSAFGIMLLLHVHNLNVVWAELPTIEETGLVSDDYSLTGTLIKIIIVLAVIIGLIILLVRFLAQKNRGWNANRSIRLLGGVALGQNKSLQIVEIANRIYILGVGNEVQLIEMIEEQEAVSSIVEALTSSPYADTGAGFNQMVQWFRKRRNSDQPYGQADEIDMGDNINFQRILQDKLKNNYTSKIQYIDELSDHSDEDRTKDKR